MRVTDRALLLSGAARYADPWHPFARTSAAIADVLAGEGFEVELRDDVDAALAGLVGSAPDLLVVNVGDPNGPRPDGTPGEPDAALDALSRAGLLAHLEAGRPLLGLHVSSTSFRFVPEWERILGGVWVRGTTMHPEYGRAHIHVDTDAHPIVAGIHDFDVDDERYSWMRVDPGVRGLVWQEHEGVRHPLLWTHRFGTAPVVYDALGHDERSYESGPRRELLARSARWLLGRL